MNIGEKGCANNNHWNRQPLEHVIKQITEEITVTFLGSIIQMVWYLHK